MSRFSIQTLNSGLAVGDAELAAELANARVALVEKLRAGLASDDRLEAVWMHGSIGRGEEDALSDIDLIVMTTEGADVSFVQALLEVVARFGLIGLANPMPVNAPEGGYFLSVFYDVEPLPISCDWSVWPFGAIRPADVVVLYERDSSRFSVGGTFDEIMSDVPRSALFLESAEALSSRLFMVLPIAKDAVRGWSGSVEIMRQYLPFELGPARSMAHVISMLRELVDEHADQERQPAVTAVRRYLSGVERLLPMELRA